MGIPYIPSFSEMLAVSHSRGADSDAPGLWGGLCDLWPLAAGGGNTAFDLSGYGRNGTWSGTGSHWVAGERGVAGQFNGSDDYADAGTGQQVSEFTIVAWCRDVPYANSVRVIVARLEVGAPFERNYQLSINPYNEINLHARTSGTSYTAYTRPAGFYATSTAFDTWRMVAATWAGGAEQFYVDGLPVATTSGSITAIGTPTTPVLLIGGNSLTPGQPYNGLMGDLRVYNRALAAAEIQQLYADPFASLRLRRKVYPVVAGAIMNQLQGSNVGADLFNGALM